MSATFYQQVAVHGGGGGHDDDDDDVGGHAWDAPTMDLDLFLLFFSQNSCVHLISRSMSSSWCSENKKDNAGHDSWWRKVSEKMWAMWKMKKKWPFYDFWRKLRKMWKQSSTAATAKTIKAWKLCHQRSIVFFHWNNWNCQWANRRRIPLFWFRSAGALVVIRKILIVIFVCKARRR